MTHATIPWALVLVVFSCLVCAALSQLKYSGLFNWPMMLATTLGAFVLMVFSLFLCAAYSGSFNYPMTLATIPGSLVLGVYFLILICAAFIQLKYSGSFTCPMTLVTTLGAHVLGVSTLNDTRCNNDNQLQQSMELLFWWYFSLFGMCCLYPIEVLLFIYLSNGTCNNSSSSCLGDVFLKWHMLWHSPSTCNVIYCILFTSIFHLLSPQ